MRVRDHLALSAAGAALLRPWLGSRVLGLLAGGVLIDIDHYAWFCLRHRCLNPVTAVRYFTAAAPQHHAGTRALHSPVAIAAICAAARRRPALLSVAAGMAVHAVLDSRHEARMRAARTAALRRDRFTCQACGSTAVDVGAHLQHQPWLLPSYASQNLISLCSSCHEAAHRRERPAHRWT